MNRTANPALARLVMAAWVAGGALACGDGDPAAVESRVRDVCSRCHAFPPPEILPAGLWRTQIERMAELGADPPAPSVGPAVEFSVEEVVRWYEERAPERLDVLPRLTREGPAPLRFRRRNVLLGAGGGPGIATVRRLGPGLLPGLEPSLATPHMANGSIHLFSLERGPLRIGGAGHPARIAQGDLDGDGRDELVIADLGNPMPSDEPVGRVVVARRVPQGSGRDFAFETILEGVGRVADARPFDLDGDGDLDIAVAAFGWLARGGIHVLVNETLPGGPLRFRAERLVERSGAVSAIPVAGLLGGPEGGVVAAFAQHHELVSLFERRANGWEERILYRAPHPNWGMGDLEPVDLDADGDLDFLLAHGDTLDDGLAFKPYHGVEWLENAGDGGFRAQRIGTLYGAHRAEAADLDGDGDLDVVACGFLPQVQLPVPRGGMQVDSVIWFERTPREWIPWAIEIDHPRHTGMTAVDLDGDGRLDLVAAINRAWDLEAVESGPSLEVWFNLGRRGPPPDPRGPGGG
jgi:hypothetical protein